MLYIQERNMNLLLPNLYIGNARDSFNYNRLVEKGITAILSLTPSVEISRYPDIVSTKVGLDDGKNNTNFHYRTAVDLLDYLLKAGHTTLLHCQMGVSRTPSIAILYLIKYKCMTLKEAKELVFSIRPICQNMHPCHLEHIKEILEQDNVAF